MTTGVAITQNVTGLTAETAYHWRVRLRLRSPGAGGRPLGARVPERAVG